MPAYLQASLALAATTPILANAVPAPRMRSGHVGTLCLCLLVSSALTFIVAAGVVVLGLLTILPGFVVITPALAGLAIAVVLSMTSCWISTSQERIVDEAEESDPDSDSDDGGGGLRPEDEPPRDPGPSDGIAWDAFDLERQAWEATRTERDRDAERELVGV
ncbi:hypothetical protein DSM112329_01210 [Paraconexibacter sp. AEG42_29]|uniref:Uncharacterized protein n=1 Tax=Paraconexibacter sp. AEG42_29 TaxID=2997339 RepID=A0AAU7ART9_9ACTN